jgi:uncharacterized protein Yka (UPF0111/DUF47 family)
LNDSRPPSRTRILEGARRRWRRILLPQAPDVLGLLVAQGDVTVTGLAAFDAWSHGGGQDAVVAVRDAQHEAYTARRELLGALRAALSTPVDQEDLYVLSERVDRILNVARNAVREAEVLGWVPDAHAARMGARVSDATRELVAGFALLKKDPDDAGRRADAASDAVRELERDYRDAMTGLLTVEDIRAVLTAQNVYRRYLRVGDAIVALADRLWYVVLRGA